MLIISAFLHFLSELCLRPNQEDDEQPWSQTDLLLGMLSIWLFSKLLPGEVSTWTSLLHPLVSQSTIAFRLFDRYSAVIVI